MLDKVPAAPELRMGLELFYSAFWDLHTCRAAGMDLGPISWLSIDAYATARRFADEQRDDLHFHIRSMDRAFLEHREKQAEKGRKRGDQTRPPGVRGSNPKAGRGRGASGR